MLLLNSHSIITNKQGNISYAPIFFPDDNIVNSDENIVALIYESDIDLFNLQLLVGYLRDNVKSSGARLHLVLPYLPYGDIIFNKTSDNLKLPKYISKIINDLNFDSVELWEPYPCCYELSLNRVININKLEDMIPKAIMYELNISGSSWLVRKHYKGFDVTKSTRDLAFSYEGLMGQAACEGIHIVHIDKTRQLRTDSSYEVDIISHMFSCDISKIPDLEIPDCECRYKTAVIPFNELVNIDNIDDEFEELLHDLRMSGFTTISVITPIISVEAYSKLINIGIDKLYLSENNIISRSNRHLKYDTNNVEIVII